MELPRRHACAAALHSPLEDPRCPGGRLSALGRCTRGGGNRRRGSDQQAVAILEVRNFVVEISGRSLRDKLTGNVVGYSTYLVAWGLEAVMRTPGSSPPYCASC